jgi:hypothetical protein
MFKLPVNQRKKKKRKKKRNEEIEGWLNKLILRLKGPWK